MYVCSHCLVLWTFHSGRPTKIATLIAPTGLWKVTAHGKDYDCFSVVPPANAHFLRIYDWLEALPAVRHNPYNQ